MCKVYGTIGSLTTVKNHLLEHNIDDFSSLKEVMDFQKNFENLRKSIISKHEELIYEEFNQLNKSIPSLSEAIQVEKDKIERVLRNEIDTLNLKLSNSDSMQSEKLLFKLLIYIKHWYYKLIICFKEYRFESVVEHSLKHFQKLLSEKFERQQFIMNHFDDAVTQSSMPSLIHLDRKKSIIDEVNASIYGAIGENKVVKELEKLSDDYILINDFSVSFSYPIYHYSENDYIGSVQIDHILIAPSGIFLIETKNWSRQSLDDITFRSPVQQVKRAGYVLKRLLKDYETFNELRLYEHRWGKRKIPVRNLIVFTNSLPVDEFEYVKILTIKELLGYIRFFKPVFSSEETEHISLYLRNLSHRVINTK